MRLLVKPHLKIPSAFGVSFQHEFCGWTQYQAVEKEYVFFVVVAAVVFDPRGSLLLL